MLHYGVREPVVIPRRSRVWGPRCLAGIVAAAVAVSAGCAKPDALPLRRGDPAPSFSAEPLRGGRAVSLRDYRGLALLVNLWATWCHPCREETPYLQELYHRYRDDGLRILGVSVDRRADLDAVADFVAEMGVEYDIVLDPDARSQDAFRARGLPTSVLIDRQGAVYFSWTGPVPEGDPAFLAGLEDALGR